MNYFNVSFHYRESSDPSASNTEAYNKIASAFDDIGIEWRWEYGYPDGSLYLLVKSGKTLKELENYIKQILPPGTWLDRIYDDHDGKYEKEFAARKPETKESRQRWTELARWARERDLETIAKTAEKS